MRWEYVAGNFVYSGSPYQVRVEHIDGLEAVYTANEATDAGNYTAIVRFRLGGMDEKYYFVDSDREYSLQWSILPKSLNKPEPPSDTSFEYSESEHILFEYEFEGVQITGNAAKEVGNYTAVLSLLNDNYIWSDGTKEPLLVDWSIVKKVLVVNADFGWGKIDYYQSGFYDGKEQGYVLQDESRLDDYYTVVYSGNRQILPGQYVAKAILQSRYDSKNYELQDRNGDSLGAELSLTMDWEIQRGACRCRKRRVFGMYITVRRSRLHSGNTTRHTSASKTTYRRMQAHMRFGHISRSPIYIPSAWTARNSIIFPSSSSSIRQHRIFRL